MPLEHLQGLLQPADADELGLRLRASLRSSRRWPRTFACVSRIAAASAAGCASRSRPLGRGSALGLSGVLLDISEGRRQEERVQAAHARLRSLIDSAPVVIYVQRVEQGHLVPEFYSESASNLLGLDLQGQSWQALAERVHPDDLEAFSPVAASCFARGRVKTRYRLADGQGNWHWLYDEAKLLRDAQGLPSEAVGLWLDVTEQHLAAQRIAESATLLVLVEDSPALICRYTADLVLTYVNRTFADSLATSPERLVGRRLDEWLAAEDASALRARLLGSPREGASEVPELRFNLPGQRFLWLVWAERPLFDARGGVRGTGGGTRQHAGASGPAATGARRQDGQPGEMVSGLAHEVKQPLHVLRMTLFNMRQRMNSVGLDGDYLGEKLERMDAQVLRVDRLVSHLGVFSRKSALEALPFDLYRLRRRPGPARRGAASARHRGGVPGADAADGGTRAGGPAGTGDHQPARQRPRCPARQSRPGQPARSPGAGGLPRTGLGRIARARQRRRDRTAPAGADIQAPSSPPRRRARVPAWVSRSATIWCATWAVA